MHACLVGAYDVVVIMQEGNNAGSEYIIKYTSYNNIYDYIVNIMHMYVVLA
jgi:hypothetical protein